MRKNISFNSSFLVFKYLPIIFLFLYLIAIIDEFKSYDNLFDRILVIGFFFIPFILIYIFIFFRIKLIQYDEKNFYISNEFKTVKVKKTELIKVNDLKFLKIIRLKFKNKTKNNRIIYFVPQPFKRLDILDELIDISFCNLSQSIKKENKN